MIRNFLCFALILMSASFLPFTAKGAGKDCNDEMTQAGMNACALEAYKSADEDMNKVYMKAVQYLKDNFPAKLQSFVNAQKDWLKFRDANCDFAESIYEGGSMAPMVNSQCLEDLTLERTRQIPFFFPEWE